LIFDFAKSPLLLNSFLKKKTNSVIGFCEDEHQFIEYGMLRRCNIGKKNILSTNTVAKKKIFIASHLFTIIRVL